MSEHDLQPFAGDHRAGSTLREEKIDQAH